jgi:hypothetical protein
MANDDPDRLLTPEELAVALKIKVNTLAKWRVQGSGPRFRRIGRLIRYGAKDSREWLDGQTRSSTGDDGNRHHRR